MSRGAKGLFYGTVLFLFFSSSQPIFLGRASRFCCDYNRQKLEELAACKRRTGRGKLIVGGLMHNDILPMISWEIRIRINAWFSKEGYRSFAEAATAVNRTVATPAQSILLLCASMAYQGSSTENHQSCIMWAVRTL
jgi:hypothetical protein